MKKIFKIMITLVLTVSLFGCQKKERMFIQKHIHYSTFI